MTINSSAWQTLFINVNLATMTDGANSYGAIKNGALAISEGKIAWLGEKTDLPKYNEKSVQTIDGKGKWLTPGLVDCHTHLVYGGNRANEFEMRLQGKSYQEIANAGGGIISTVSATRKASESQLLASALPRLTTLHQQGVTSIEIKSGYGLDTMNEIKMLKVAGQLAEKLPVTIKRTFLGAHALPIEYKEKPDEYIDLVCNEMIPLIVKESLADAVDVFCEGIGFSLEQTERVFAAAQKHQLPIKVHAEQLSNLGGTALAAKYNALSSDHIEFLDEAGIKAMKNADMTAVLLPGAFYFLRETQLPPMDLLRKHEVPMAIATDANPGSSPIHNIQLMLNMACTFFRLTPTEALAGVTCHGAKALGLSNKKGQLAVDFDADIAMWNIEQPAELCYQFGVNPLDELFVAGHKVI
ncbi:MULTISPECIES: imidazolonepropionase [unclassified Colwellia]|uniref:imidazolonepropionase n=1 Tax=unclassified Colwellia TaxID=196834 RepID=UPI0015F69628|nr:MULTISPECIES: imidazolonepropionase [unclassified Colwellia]MBA6232335.1 imidazolonepropionase [Colwellia sp. MB02u-7]MBA6236011.1 imidazolonepropionase [Colwellia sp. MB02u-11]MBA6256735.1 imidazolonepropionase [Colwellia sp. MB3u-28]MBA6261450.1 imidazolonepropionase [Colwellia sp. MB3u-41]MBA6298584.1 imidazolonepropionase [Colwellia sp. MB3u-22]